MVYLWKCGLDIGVSWFLCCVCVTESVGAGGQLGLGFKRSIRSSFYVRVFYALMGSTFKLFGDSAIQRTGLAICNFGN